MSDKLRFYGKIKVTVRECILALRNPHFGWILDFGRCNIENPKFFALAEETKQKREYFEAGIRPYFLMPVFYFLIKSKVQPGNLRIAKRVYIQ